jgi:hypothetical protein
LAEVSSNCGRNLMKRFASITLAFAAFSGIVLITSVIAQTSAVVARRRRMQPASARRPLRVLFRDHPRSLPNAHPTIESVRWSVSSRAWSLILARFLARARGSKGLIAATHSPPRARVIAGHPPAGRQHARRQVTVAGEVWGNRGLPSYSGQGLLRAAGLLGGSRTGHSLSTSAGRRCNVRR